MRFKKEWLEHRWVNYALALIVGISFYMFIAHFQNILGFLSQIFGYISPVFYGLIIAYVLHPIVEFFEEKCFSKFKKPRLFSVFITTIICIFVIGILFYSLIPPIIESLLSFMKHSTTYADNMQKWLKNIHYFDKTVHIDIPSIIKMVTDNYESYTGSIPGNIKSIATTSFYVTSGVFNLFISFILAIYFLLDAKKMQSGLKRFLRAILSTDKYGQLASFWNRCNHILIKYILCDLLDGFIIGVANFIFMTIMHMPFVSLVSVIVGVTNLAPTFGPIVGGVIGALFLVLINPWDALWFIIFTIVLQTIDGYVIKPNLFGDSLGVSSIMILIFIIVGGRMFGIWGIILAIPVAAICDFLYKDLWNVYLKPKYDKKVNK